MVSSVACESIINNAGDKKENFILKEEAHRPHRSPDKTVQINKYIKCIKSITYDNIITLIKRRKKTLLTL